MVTGPEDTNDTSPFPSMAEFELAKFLFTQEQMSGKKIDRLMDILATLYPDSDPPFANHHECYSLIDAIELGNIPWQSFTVKYDGPVPDDGAPSWMSDEYKVWYHDPLQVMEQQIGNADFVSEFDVSPKHVFDAMGKRQYSDLMSGNWA